MVNEDQPELLARDHMHRFHHAQADSVRMLALCVCAHCAERSTPMLSSLVDDLARALYDSQPFSVCFVDLRPVPPEAVPLSAEGFALLVGVLLASSHLDARTLADAVDDVDVATKVRRPGTIFGGTPGLDWLDCRHIWAVSRWCAAQCKVQQLIYRCMAGA
jgi:hypothetical protein